MACGLLFAVLPWALHTVEAAPGKVYISGDVSARGWVQAAVSTGKERSLVIFWLCDCDTRGRRGGLLLHLFPRRGKISELYLLVQGYSAGKWWSQD